MRKIDEILKYLGEPYSIRTIDGEAVIYRDLGTGFDFEVSGIRQGNDHFTLYVWQTQPHHEIVGIYTGIHGAADLKDILGHYAFMYQNLQEKIRVEREDM